MPTMPTMPTITTTLTMHVNTPRVIGHSLVMSAAPHPEAANASLWQNVEFNVLLNSVATAHDMANWFSRLAALLVATAKNPVCTAKEKDYLTMLAIAASDLSIALAKSS